MAGFSSAAAGKSLSGLATSDGDSEDGARGSRDNSVPGDFRLTSPLHYPLAPCDVRSIVHFFARRRYGRAFCAFPVVAQPVQGAT